MFSSFRKLFGMRAETAGSGQLVAIAPPMDLPTRTSALRAVRVEVPSRSAAPVVATAKGAAINVPLSAIIARLLPVLSPRVRITDVGTAEVSIPVQKVLAQIAQGAVKISFGELRQSSPGVFSPEIDQDETLVEVPLHEILSRLDPALLPRRAAQKQVAVPQDVTGPFGGQSQVMFSDGKVKPAAVQPVARVETPIAPSIPIAPIQPLPPQRPLSMPQSPAPIVAATPRVETPGISFQPPQAIAPALTPAPAVQPAASVAPVIALPQVVVAPASGNTSFWSAPAAAPVAAPKPAAPAIEEPIFKKVAPVTPAPVEPISIPAPVAPLQPVVQAPSIPVVEPSRVAAPIASDTAVIKMAQAAELPLNAVAPTPMAQPLNLAETRFLTVSLSEVCRGWPEALNRELVAQQLTSSSLAMPFGVIELAIRQGKVALPWRIVRTWIKPMIAAASSPHDATILELPLKVITPIFLAEMNGSKPQRKVAIDATIPNVFSGKGATASSLPENVISSLINAAPARLAPPAPVSAPLPTKPLLKPKSADTNYFAKKATEVVVEEAAPIVKKGATPGTDFLNRYATPNEIVGKAAALEGVEGALIALPDGLLVASDIPPTMNADTIAAFLPQIFGKVAQSTKELRLGELNNLNFTVGNIPWKIFKVGAIYFAAFGSADEPLPTAQLVAIAAELDRKAK